VRDAFIRRGFDAISCDIVPSEVSGPHYEGEVEDILSKGWDCMIAFPPCTYLSAAGACHWKRPGRKEKQEEALDFVRLLMKSGILHIAIENPTGAIAKAIRPANQIIHPYQFGDPWMKRTCLWLQGLPLLRATDEVKPVGYWISAQAKSKHKLKNVLHYGHSHSKMRSAAFPGIAEAMAHQWGNYLLEVRNGTR
jgi:hypothetical protein